MKVVICERCGSGEFVDQGEYRVCQYCNTQYQKTSEDVTKKASNIALENDLSMLLQKCRDDPENSQRYASLVLDIDPGNLEALKYIKRR